MKQFVLIFRQGSGGPVSPEERAKRTAEIREWARGWIEQGYSFDPRQLEQESYLIAPDGEGDGEGDAGIGLAVKDEMARHRADQGAHGPADQETRRCTANFAPD